MYWINLWREIMVWREVKTVAAQNLDLLRENNLRVDWIGRIYTVFNLPPEVIETPNTREPWLSAQLKVIDDVLIQLNISDIVYPEFTQIAGTDSYLLILYPELEYINITRFLVNCMIWGLGIYALVVLWRFINSLPVAQQLIDSISKFL
jgi:hypothetical protein